MGFLDRAIRQGLSEGLGKAVSGAIEKAVTPKAEEYANKTAQRLDQAAQSAGEQTQQAVGGLGGLSGAFANLQRAAEGYVTEMSKGMKICPDCGQPASAEQKFCPACGSKLPEETLAQGAVCPACGKQNTLGTKFCTDCGGKLPSTIQEEQAAQAADAAVLERWAQLLVPFPAWPLGGTELDIQQEDGYVMFSARMADAGAAKSAVTQYRILLQENDFRPAGEYPSVSHLYKMSGGLCCHCDTEHSFDGDPDRPTLYFDTQEPAGGFNYQKPQPKPQPSLKDLFKF